jgi:DNA-binding response OmpR family regulator
MKKVLFIEDDLDLYESVKGSLERVGFRVIGGNKGRNAIDLCASEWPHLILLEFMLPDLSGLEICKWVRAHRVFAETPLIFIGASASEVDRVVALELGANDYIVKPFSIRELLLRIRLHLRPPAESAPALLWGGGVELDQNRCRVLQNGTQVALTATEFRLLAFLMRHSGVVFSRQQLLHEVWRDRRTTLIRTVDVYIMHLRKKLEVDPTNPKLIRSARGFGYSFDPWDCPAVLNGITAPLSC